MSPRRVLLLTLISLSPTFAAALFPIFSSVQAAAATGSGSVALSSGAPAPDASLTTHPMRSVDQLHLFKLIDATVAHQQAANAGLKELLATQTQLKLDLDRIDQGQWVQGQIEQKPPYSILLFDQLTDAIAGNETKHASLEETLLSARTAVERASAEVTRRERTSKQISESDTILFSNLLRTAEAELRLAQQTLILRRQELATQQTRYDINRIELRLHKRRRDLIAPAVVFSQQTFDAQMQKLDERGIEIQQKADAFQTETQFAERRWMERRQTLMTTPSPPPELRAEVDALKTALETLRIASGVNHQRIVRLPIMRQYWQRRYHLASGQSTRPDRQSWLAETKEQIVQFDRERRARELALKETRSNLASATTHSHEQDLVSEELRRWLAAKTESLSEQSDLHNRAIIGIDSGARALSRLQVELEGGPSRSFQDWLSDTWSTIRRGWNYELAHIEDTSLTVGRVLSSLLFIVFGYFAARLISRLIGRRLPKLGVDPAAAHAIESLSFYALAIAFSLTSLRYANVPLTVFTFLGGAVAIGVGFGSQNILNNFISGLILLVERPIKVGDLIVVDDTHGNVTKIGARSTQVRTGDNLDIIVPNSKFLENNVVNLTRLDNRLRTSIKIRLAYESSLDLVMSLLVQAAVQTPGVHAEPAPFVWFNDFGEEALEFEVNFWLSATSLTERKDCETLVRLSIDRIFREHGISIEVPRHDLQLSSADPIAMRIVSDETKGERQVPGSPTLDREIRPHRRRPRAAG